jgi:hypothetical protein
MHKHTMYGVVVSVAVLGAALGIFAQQPAQAPEGQGKEARAKKGGPPRVNMPGVFFREDWTRPANEPGQVPIKASNVSNPNLELKVYGLDAKNLTISGVADNPTGPINLWTGLCTAPVAATLRDKNNYVDLTGLAKVRWITRASGFHVVRPVVKLADGTMLVGDHTDASTTTFLESEFAFTGMRWIRLDPERVVTTGVYGPVGEASSWVENPDLSKVDEVGFADLMPGTGHGSGGWVNVSRMEVYGKAVKR